MPQYKEKVVPKWVSDNRETLNRLKEKEEEIDSYSKIESFNECKGSYDDTYNKKKKRANNIYAIIGGEIHDALEDIYVNQWTLDENRDRLTQAVMSALKKIGDHNYNFENKVLNEKGELIADYPIKFMNQAVEDNFMKAIYHYIKFFKKEDHHRLTEALVLTKLNGRWLQGFIDVIEEDQNGPGKTLKIVDYKTSTMWVGEQSTKEHARQMILYAWMIKQTFNVEVTSVGWDMIKYINIKYKGKTRKKKTLIRRDQIFSDKYGVLKEMYDAFKVKGYDALDTATIMAEGMQNEMIPDEIIDMFEVWNGYVDYPINDEIIQETVDYITNTMNEIANEKTWDRRPIDKNNEMYCTWLCNNRTTCEVRRSYFEKHIEEKTEEKKTNYDNVFG